MVLWNETGFAMRKILRKTIFATAAVALILFAGCSTQRRETTTVVRTLPNGITIAVQENYASEVVAVQLWMRDGVLFEKPEEAGIANLLREMMFAQTEGAERGEIGEEIEYLGGTHTTACRHDFVQYAAIVPADYFRSVMELLHEGLTKPVFDEELLEWAKGASSNPAIISSRSIDRAYRLCLKEIMGDHPYGRPYEGDPDIVKALTVEDVRERFEERYVGNNMLVAVSGSVDAVDAADLVADVLSDIEPGVLAEPASPPVTWPTESSRVVETGDVRNAIQVIAFPGPGVTSADSVTMDVLLVILMEGRSSRLNVRLREELGLASYVGAGWFTQHQPSPLFVWMDLPSENLEEAEKAVVDLLKEFATEEVSPEELAKAKVLLETGNLRMVETAEGSAFHLGYWNSIGGEEFASRYLERLNQTTAEQIQEAAAKYFGDGVHATAVILPE